MSLKTQRRVNRFYHASPYRLRHGTILRYGIKDQNFKTEYYNEGVFLTIEPNPHFTVRTKAIEQNWYVYEVTPIGDIQLGGWNDLVCQEAKVIKCVGNARGIGSRHKRGSYYRGGCNKVKGTGAYYRHPNIVRPHWVPDAYLKDWVRVKELINNPDPKRARLYRRLGMKVTVIYKERKYDQE